MKIFDRFILTFAVLTGLGFCCATTGCRSTAGSRAAHDLIVRSEHPGQISEAIVAEFEAEGFLVAAPGMTRMVFEKEGSEMRTLAYGDWLGGPVWIRVKTSVSTIGPDQYRLDCQAFLVRDRGGLTEEETRTSNRKYKAILKRAARRASGS